tara:strand:+ start:37 stop:1881 length:1845 start_codon:yes stop_codon:yes gene_type:complete
MNVKDCIGLILILILICLLYSYLKSKLVEGLTVNEAINLQSECLYGEYPIGGNTPIPDCPTGQNTSSEECCLCPVGKALPSGSSRLKSSTDVSENDCEDIDECATGTDNCDTNAACTNTIGSFSCVCNSSYTGDGVTCSENTCTAFGTIPDGYILDPAGTTVTDVNLSASCADGFSGTPSSLSCNGGTFTAPSGCGVCVVGKYSDDTNTSGSCDDTQYINKADCISNNGRWTSTCESCPTGKSTASNGSTASSDCKATCGDKDGTGAAIDDSDCGAGYIANPGAGTSLCAGDTCNVSGVPEDKAACCVAQATCGDKDGEGPGSAAIDDADCGAGYSATLGAAAATCVGTVCDMNEADDKAACCTENVSCDYEWGDFEDWDEPGSDESDEGRETRGRSLTITTPLSQRASTNPRCPNAWDYDEYRCKAGYYRSNAFTNSSLTCSPCPTGKYSSAGTQTSCIACTNANYNFSSGPGILKYPSGGDDPEVGNAADLEQVWDAAFPLTNGLDCRLKRDKWFWYGPNPENGSDDKDKIPRISWNANSSAQTAIWNMCPQGTQACLPNINNTQDGLERNMNKWSSTPYNRPWMCKQVTHSSAASYPLNGVFRWCNNSIFR